MRMVFFENLCYSVVYRLLKVKKSIRDKWIEILSGNEEFRSQIGGLGKVFNDTADKVEENSELEANLEKSTSKTSTMKKNSQQEKALKMILQENSTGTETERDNQLQSSTAQINNPNVSESMKQFIQMIEVY